MSDQYRTLKSESKGIHKDRGSKFLAYAYSCYTVVDCQQRLEEVKRLHPKARHHCYAYRLGLEGSDVRANDDGEPSGTAGRPILGQIDSAGLTNILIVVVRYFGGTLLGTSGLINAYKQSALAAIDNAELIEKTVIDIYQLDFEYHLMSNVMNAVKRMDLKVTGQDFAEQARLTIAIGKSKVAETLRQLKAFIFNLHLEQVEDFKPSGFTVRYLRTE